MQKRHTCMYVICTPHHMHARTHLNTHRHARAWCVQTAPCGCLLRNTFLPSPSFSIIHSLSILCPAPCWSLSLRYLYILSTSHFMEKSGFPPISLLDLRISWFTLLPLLWNKHSLALPSLSPKPGSSFSSPCLLTPLCPPPVIQPPLSSGGRVSTPPQSLRFHTSYRVAGSRSCFVPEGLVIGFKGKTALALSN